MTVRFLPPQRRNIVFVGQPHVGKTSLAEAILFEAGAVSRIGSTDDGSSHFDFEAEEIKHHSTLKEAVYDFTYEQNSITLLDTPGSSDFIADTLCALRAADVTVLVVGALSGVKVQAEKVWALARAEGTARVIFVGELDKENANFEQTIQSARTTLKTNPLLVQVPLEYLGAPSTVVDLLSLTGYRIAQNGKPERFPLPKAILDGFAEQRTALVEAIAETDDALLEKYLERNEIEQSELFSAFRRAVARGSLTPVFAGSPTTRVGIGAFLRAIVDYLPSPVERTPYKALDDEHTSIVANPEKPFIGMVFKTFADPFTGQISLVRVVQGKLHSDDVVLNTRSEEEERMGKLHLQLGKETQNIDEVGPGAIVSVAKLKNTHTGDTLCDKSLHTRLLGFKFPDPAISFAVDPKTRKDEDKILQAISQIAEEDPAISIRRDPSTHQTLVYGQSQSHIEIMLERIWRKFHVEGIIHPPKIPYRETITANSEAQGRHKKQTGGHGQFGDCWLRINPLPRGSGFTFKNEVFGGAIPRNFIPAVEKGVIEGLDEGFLCGYPIVDIEVTVFDGSYHAVDSSELSFKLAAIKALKTALEKSHPILLEPIINIEITVPDDYTGAVLGDLNAHRGRVQNMESDGEVSVITAHAPMAEMPTYSATLRSMTGDRGHFRADFLGYEEVPAAVAERLLPELRKEHAHHESLAAED